MIKKLRAKKKIAMSGTPIANKAQDVWNLIDFCHAGVFGNYWAFINRYCLKNKWGGIFGYVNMDELREKLKRYMIRRTKEEVLPDLPEKMTTDVVFVLSEEEAALQTKIKKEILFEIEATDINKLETPMTLQYTIVKFGRLRQLADSLELLGENKKSSKLEVLKELLQENVENGRKVIIFSEFAEMCKILKRELIEYNPAMVIGETAADKREQELTRFKIDPVCRIAILSSAGAYGLNLTEASIIINYDLPFSLSKLEQRIGRAHRYGQKNKVQIFNLLGKGTADMGIKKIIHAKSELSTQLLGDIPVTMNDIKEMLYD
jgi:SNF2 family DNA or RNA helicase